MPGVGELRKTLVDRGFEVYRVLEDRIVLAERVRDNLIMDSGVSAGYGSSLCVHFVVRAQANDFPTEAPERLLSRARRLAECAVERGYVEVGTAVVDVRAPGDETRTLDTWHEVAYQKAVHDQTEFFSELRYALSLPKTAQVVRT
ncbi:MAG TPA: hypothetical protein VGJ84_16540 [Polyangiaceae bacterium]|jgi:hypothetical protein